jgi:NAD(P)-dependent dehydrogenase (short-subunit alcohol dehydrogenase family)
MANPRTVVITGCSRGIGFGILNHLAQSHTCKFVIGIARNEKDVEELGLKFKDNPKVSIMRGDVADERAMFAVAAQVRASGHTPDLLICNAGILTEPRSFDQIPVGDLERTLQVNLIGCFNTMRAFLPQMRNIEGAVMANVSSGWGLFGSAGEATYCASKHALEGLVKCAAEDVAIDPISIVTVRPGVVCTDLLATACGGKDKAKVRGIPVERFAEPFCDKVMAITKQHSGTHVDCSYKGPIDW